MFKTIKKYWIFLILLVSVSYGQILQMFPWQDDHALMFKLGNIIEKAGYLGTGIFGEGPYKYTAAFYYPIYQLFDYNITLYFLLSFVCYLLATFSIYYVISNIFDKKSGRLAGFLFGAGYVASDGFIRLYNSVGTSLSIILITFLIYFYWEFYKKRKVRFYLFALFLFFLATEFVRYRTHYLISVVVVYELLFLTFNKPLFKSIRNSIVRLLPFGYIFYKYFIVAGDSRSGKVLEYIQAILRGEFYQTYSFFASITNLIVPDWLLDSFVKHIPNRILAFITSGIFSNSVLNLQSSGKIVPIIGIIIFVSCIYIISKEKSNKHWLAFFFFWMVVNIASYAAYLPTNAYETTNRLLAHSFVALIGIFIILAKSKKVFYYLIIFWGLGNLVSSYNLQKSILLTRSLPAKEFYFQLKQIVPKLEKGDVLYFDVSDLNRQKFSDAFSVAQMPEETAIAWQYGIDRYDIRRFTEYLDFQKTIANDVITDKNKDEVKIKNIYSFFYSKDGLVKTTDQLKKGLEKKYNTEKVEFNTKQTNDSLEIEFKKPVTSVTPINLLLEIKANPPNTSNIKFPFMNNQNLAKNTVAKNDALRQKAFDYQKNKNLLYQNYNITTSSIWKEDLGKNMVDNRIDTYWRADRVLWSKEGAFFTIDIGSIQNIDRFVWINGYANNTPTKYTIETSIDNKNWTTVFNKESSKRIEPNVLNVDKFDLVKARYVRMTIQNTLSNDSASIAEVWIVPIAFEDLDITKAEEFLTLPFGYVPNIQSYQSTLVELNYFGDIQVLWLGNKSKDYKTQSDSIINIKYDNQSRLYNITIPAGGIEITKIKFLQSHILGVIQVKDMFIVPNNKIY